MVLTKPSVIMTEPGHSITMPEAEEKQSATTLRSALGLTIPQTSSHCFMGAATSERHTYGTSPIRSARLPISLPGCKTSTPTPYLSPTSPSVDTDATSVSSELEPTPFGSPQLRPRRHDDRFLHTSVAKESATGGSREDSKTEQSQPQISLLTALLQQHQQTSGESARDEGDGDFVLSPTEMDPHQPHHTINPVTPKPILLSSNNVSPVMNVRTRCASASSQYHPTSGSILQPSSSVVDSHFSHASPSSTTTPVCTTSQAQAEDINTETPLLSSNLHSCSTHQENIRTDSEPVVQSETVPRKSCLTFAVVAPCSTPPIFPPLSAMERDAINQSTNRRKSIDGLGQVHRHTFADETILEDDHEQDEELQVLQTEMDNEMHAGDGDGVQQFNPLEVSKVDSLATETTKAVTSYLSKEWDDLVTDEDDEDEDFDDQEDDDDDEDEEDDDDQEQDQDDMDEDELDEEEEEEDDDEYQSTGQSDLQVYTGSISGYEEDSEAGFSSEDDGMGVRNLALKTSGRSPRPGKSKWHHESFSIKSANVALGASLSAASVDAEKQTRMVSPRRRKGVSVVRQGHLLIKETNVVHEKPSESHASTSRGNKASKYAFARPTNYRRRRPVSDHLNDGIIGGSASSLLGDDCTSFVRIERQNGSGATGKHQGPPIQRGRGCVQIQHPVPTVSAHVKRSAKSGTESCTRHCSPPPRLRSMSDEVRGAVVSEMSSTMIARTKSMNERASRKDTIAPPAGLSPSAGRLKLKRGVSDPPRQRRRSQPEAAVFGLKSRHSNPTSAQSSRPNTAETLSDARSTSTRVTGAHEPVKLSSLRGWRSDDAIFAVPTVRRPRNPTCPLVRPVRSATQIISNDSSSNHGVVPTCSDSLNGIHSGARRASETLATLHTNPRCSPTPLRSSEPRRGAQTETESTESIIPRRHHKRSNTTGFDTSSPGEPCQTAIDRTPALAFKAGPSCPPAPAEQMLHLTLASSDSPFEPSQHDTHHPLAQGGPTIYPHPNTLRPTKKPTPFEFDRAKTTCEARPVDLSPSRPIQCPLPKRPSHLVS